VHHNSSYSVQVHNFPRKSAKDPQALREAMVRGDTIVPTYGKRTTDILKSMLRPMIIPAPGKVLVVADWSGVEARGLPWLSADARADEVLDVFRRGDDIYITAANGIYRINGRKEGEELIGITDLQRQIGKVACIAEGSLVLTDRGLVPIESVDRYMRVWDGLEFVQHDGPVCKGYRPVINHDGLTATPDHLVWIDGAEDPVPFGVAASLGARLTCAGPATTGAPGTGRELWVWDILNAGPRNRFTVSGKLVHNCLSLGYQGSVNAFNSMAKNYGVVLPEAQVRSIVTNWRAANGWAPTFWRRLEDAATYALRHPLKQFNAGRVAYLYAEPHLWCLLPSGRLLCYPFARLDGDGISYMKAAWKPAADAEEWPRAHLYGGLLSENCTQASCNDLLRHALRKLRREMDVILHVHDEIVVECDEATAEQTRDRLREVMVSGPDWAEGFPLDVGIKIMKRYGK
jgi:DNA polymerase bacteriophage-type